MFTDQKKNTTAKNNFDDELGPLLSGSSQKKGLRFESNTFLGMTAIQRFIISVLLFMMVCILGAMFVMIFSSAAIL